MKLNPKIFDVTSIAIIPGTEFMEELDSHIEHFVV